ncbi:PASTA domain-containing protein [Micromonospora olivasterospora]|uniref:PASTA domain-containing protein n=1 Tax=Micromonospora olivasterospora TaxID=1880 RepID=A0A562I947_MICOL|nr:PASTA domain-containing protein [Micromonospora olivasterospora]TWH67539.1 PASTA domain-containing protein [Micromonospora olivasterospora]
MSDDRDESSPADEPTRPLPRPGETARQEPAPAVWSGRAGVPAPRPTEYREPAGGGWYAEEQAGGRWWAPIVLGIVALLLLGLLGVGVWLILRAEESPGPRQGASVRPTTAPASSGAPTTEATTGGPSTTPPATTPAAVPMPPLVGLSRADAERILDELGIDHRVETRASDRPAGTVIETEPEAGRLVPAGQEAVLVVAAPPAPTTSAAPPTTGEPTATPTP